MDLDRVFRWGVRVYGLALVAAIVALMIWALDRVLLGGGDRVGWPLIVGLSVLLTVAVYVIRNVSEVGSR